MKLSEYQRSGSFFDLVKGHSDFKVKLFDFGRYAQVSDSGPHGPLVLRYLLSTHILVMFVMCTKFDYNIFHGIKVKESI